MSELSSSTILCNFGRPERGKLGCFNLQVNFLFLQPRQKQEKKPNSSIWNEKHVTEKFPHALKHTKHKQRNYPKKLLDFFKRHFYADPFFFPVSYVDPFSSPLLIKQISLHWYLQNLETRYITQKQAGAKQQKCKSSSIQESPPDQIEEKILPFLLPF